MHVILSLVCSIDVSGTYSDLCLRTKPKFSCNNSVDHWHTHVLLRITYECVVSFGSLSQNNQLPRVYSPCTKVSR